MIKLEDETKEFLNYVVEVLRKNKMMLYVLGTGLLIILGMAIFVQWVYISLFLVAIGVMVCIFFVQYLKNGPTRLIIKGEYDKAIFELGKLYVVHAHSSNAVFKDAIILSIAICYHRIGELEKSLECLDMMYDKGSDKNLDWGYYSLKAVNLMLLERNLEKAGVCLKKAVAIHSINEFLPMVAYYEVLNGNKLKAVDYITEYLNNLSKFSLRFMNRSVVVDRFTLDVENNFFIGLSYYKMGDVIGAGEYLTAAADCVYGNYFSKTAADLLNKLMKQNQSLSEETMRQRVNALQRKSLSQVSKVAIAAQAQIANANQATQDAG